MKKVLLSLVLIHFSILLMGQDITIPESQKTLITKKTADWCPFCGQWGWGLFKGMLTDNEEDALVIATHYSGDLKNDDAEAISDNFGGFYQPIFFVNGKDIESFLPTACITTDRFIQVSNRTSNERTNERPTGHLHRLYS